MEPKLCSRCNTNPRKPRRSYCDPCDKARARIAFHRRAGKSVDEIVALETAYRLRAREDAEVEARVTEALERGTDALTDLPEDPEDWTPEQVAEFNAAQLDM